MLQLTGTTDVFLGQGIPHTIPDEIVSIFETGGGVTLRAGDGVGNTANDGPLYSPGHIDEQGANTFLADSFFDVFFELDVPGLPTLHNRQALTVECIGLSQAPPQTCSYDVIGNLPLDLFDAAGVVRGALLPTPAGFPHHFTVPTPEPASWMLMASAAAIALRLRLRRPQ